MSTTTEIDLLDDPATIEADAKAVMDALAKGVRVADDVYARVEARSDRARDATFQRFGYLDDLVQQLWREIRG